ncbi:uncharacterized protein LOC100186518 [Ciona intestinalis]
MGDNYNRMSDVQRTAQQILDSESQLKNGSRCVVCEKELKHRSRLLVHLRTHTGERPFKCKICEKAFNELRDLKGHHKRVHEKHRPHMCEFCDKSFVDVGTLNKHRRIHIGAKPHTCKHCDKSFIHRGHLNLHELIHTGERPFKCDLCPKSFKRKEHVTIHKVSHSGEKPFKCENCNKTFGMIGSLRVHNRMVKCVSVNASGLEELTYLLHTLHLNDFPPVPFKCKICEKAFHELRDLKGHHKRVHEKHRPHMCEFCDKSFVDVGTLNKHRRIHIGAKPHTCKHCDKSFIEDILTYMSLFTRGKDHLSVICVQNHSNAKNMLQFTKYLILENSLLNVKTAIKHSG